MSDVSTTDHPTQPAAAPVAVAPAVPPTLPPSGRIHPRVAAGGIAALGWTVVCLALVQYAPHYAPNAALSAAVGTFVSSLAGYLMPRSSDG